MPDCEQRQPMPRPPVLADHEASRRAAQLADLRSALAAQGISSVLARTRRLVLWGKPRDYEPSGPTDPQLYIFAPGGTEIASASGGTYLFASGSAYPAADPLQAARRFAQSGDGAPPAPPDDEQGEAPPRHHPGLTPATRTTRPALP